MPRRADKIPTTTLKAVTEAILTALVEASASAAETSANLVAAYGKDEVRRRIGVPLAQITEASVTLRFAITNPRIRNRQGSDLEIILDPAALSTVDASHVQELQLRLVGDSRPVVDVEDPKNPKRRTFTIG